MTNAPDAVKGLFVYGLIIPLALVLGYLMATPGDMASAGTIGLLLMVISLPLFLKWHHPLLILSWNMSTTIFFLPGSPTLWFCMAFFSLIISLGQRALDREKLFISEPSLYWPILALGLIVLITAEVTGGFGMRVFGGNVMGGKRYLLIFAGIAGYFALTACRIPKERAQFFVGLYFLGQLSNLISTAIPYGPKELYFLAYLFPVGAADVMPVVDTMSIGFAPDIMRYFGLTIASSGAIGLMLARYGFRGILDAGKPWRGIVVLAAFVLGAMGGFRSFVVAASLTFFFVFCLEGLFRTKYALVLALVLVLGFSFMVPFARHLPLSIQRSLSTLPIDIDPIARYDAEASSEWRFQMWAIVLPEVPHYFWFGKGLGIDPRDSQIAAEFSRRSQTSSQEAAMLAGEYHSGPLTALIPFGIWGLLAWIWLLGAGIRALHRNYKFGPPELKTINTFLLAYFVARTILFFLIFGNLYTDVAEFLGLLGLSISINHGIRRSPQTEVTQEETEAEIEPVPALSRL